MYEFLTIASYILCSFLPVLFRRWRHGLTTLLFWISWLISLIGTFAGGMLGSILFSWLGWDPNFFIALIPAVLFSWLFSFIFFAFDSIPSEHW